MKNESTRTKAYLHGDFASFQHADRHIEFHRSVKRAARARKTIRKRDIKAYSCALAHKHRSPDPSSDHDDAPPLAWIRLGYLLPVA